MTYSIVAHCRRTGQYGVAVATYSPVVGARCPVIVPGRGAASVQAVAGAELTRLAAKLIADGLSAEAVVQSLRAADPYPDYRQLIVVDCYGSGAGSTGARNPNWAGHHVGDGYACAGNVMVGEQVVSAIARAFEAEPRLDLAERLMRAIEAGRDAGGQPEGQNSASSQVAGAHHALLVDLRVDLHDTPEAELRRLWDWFAPMVPYYAQRLMDPTVPRWWQWRQERVPGWIPRHLRKL